MGTLGKKFVPLNVKNTEENRRAYREVLFTTPGLNKYVSGVILFEETVLLRLINPLRQDKQPKMERTLLNCWERTISCQELKLTRVSRSCPELKKEKPLQWDLTHLEKWPQISMQLDADSLNGEPY